MTDKERIDMDYESEYNRLKSELEELTTKYDTLANSYAKLRNLYINNLVNALDNELGVYFNDKERV